MENPGAKGPYKNGGLTSRELWLEGLDKLYDIMTYKW
jgi:hypothetical protein